MKKHNKVITSLEQSMEADHDMREFCRESDHFINKKDGQWEPEVVNRMTGRPRYTFDKTNPLIDQIVGEIRNNDFTLRVAPAGGGASKRTAQVFDGLIRNIRNISNADMIFDHAAEQMVGIGCAAWEITHDYLHNDSFDQDLIIKPILDAHNRVWFDPNAIEQDKSDARWCIVLDRLVNEDYEREFPKGSGLSVGTDDTSESYYYKPEFVTIGRLIYKKEVRKDIVKMSDGKVFEDDEEFQSVVDELEAAGITVEARRTIKDTIVCQRYFDGGDWLDSEEETVFSLIPIIPVYANYRVSEGKSIYRSLTQMVMDPQRNYNYVRSREIEEGALAPRAKYWMTEKQVQGHVDKLRTLNTNADPVQLFNPDERLPGTPQQVGGATINPGLQVMAQASKQDINEAGGLFGASMGDNPNLQSGVAINSQIDRGNNGTIKYFAALQTALNYTGKVLIEAIPKVYDSTRTVRVIGEDGSSDMVTINTTIIDQQTGQLVEINDLTSGQYDITCDIGPAFKNRQDETNEAFTAMAQVYPEVAQMGIDIWLSNINAPGMDKVAERARMMAIQNGQIPDEQMSDEERAMIAEAQQKPQEPSADMVLAQAEQMKAEADVMAQQNKQMEIQLKGQELQLKMGDLQAKYQGQADKLQSETALNMAKVEQGERSLDLQSAKVQSEQQYKMMQLMIEQQKAQTDELAKLAQALNNIKSAIGADAIMSPSAINAYEETANKIDDME